MPSNAPTPYLRASDADREAAVDRLRQAAIEGRLDADELEERLTAAYAARWTSDLDRLIADVTPRPAPVAAPARYPYPPPAPSWPARPETNSLAVASLSASLCFFLWFIAPICAIVFGHIALHQIDRSGGKQRGRGMAGAGLAIGYLELAATIVGAAVWW